MPLLASLASDELVGLVRGGKPDRVPLGEGPSESISVARLREQYPEPQRKRV